ncbi:MAG: HU family DNA-binding protein [Planctomycetes bacterium]|nr:HU family DNA-binding protein [Planctomycetota bacterium]
MTKITKDFLVREIHRIMNGKVRKAHIRDTINLLFDVLSTNLKERNSIEIRNFGVFKVVESNRTKVRDFRKNKELIIKKKKKVKFVSGKKLAGLLND